MKKLTTILFISTLSILGFGQDTLNFNFTENATYDEIGWLSVYADAVEGDTVWYNDSIYIINTTIDGAVGYNTSGITGYPLNVVNTAVFTYGTVTYSIEGFSPNQEVSAIILSSRSTTSDERSGIYTIDGVSKTINASQNTDVYQWDDISADVSGVVEIEVAISANQAILNFAQIIYNIPITYCDTVSVSVSDSIIDAYVNEGAIYQDIISPTGTHSWSNGATTEDITGLTAGVYSDTLTLTDSLCQFIYTYTVEQLNPCDTTDIIITGDVINAGDTLGAINITVTGEGAEPYTYLWSTGETTQNIDSVPKGSHTVIVTDNNDCSDSATFSVLGDGTASFLVDFEDQTLEPEYGGYTEVISNDGDMYATANPDKSGLNTSDYVLSLNTPSGVAGRAEYALERAVTNEKTYIYKWKRYSPVDMWTDIEISVGENIIQNQFNTWPCEAPPVYGDYEYFDTLICDNGGVFSDIHYYPEGLASFGSRARPNCVKNFFPVSDGVWHEYTAEIYWSSTDEGYYRIWLDDVLVGYSDGLKTLMEGFIESTCDMYWTNGIYGSWSQSGGLTQDTLTAYVDDIAMYDIDSGFTITDVCPDCEIAPLIQRDSAVYKINMNLSNTMTQDGYNNYIVTWSGDTAAKDLSSTFGVSNGIDVYVWSDGTISGASNNSLTSECFPDDIIQTAANWTDDDTHTIQLKGMNPNNTYKINVYSSTVFSGDTRGVQIWTTESNRDTVLAYNNLCNTAEITDLACDVNGDLDIYISTISLGTAYLNSIELVEYVGDLPIDYCDSITWETTSIITDVTTYDGSDGAIDFSVSGGYGNYDYLWSNDSTTQDITDLIAGVYSVTVTDDSSCTKTINYSVTQPDAPVDPCDTTIILSSGNITEAIDSTYSIELTVSGGVEPYTYSWSNGATTKDLSGLDAGTYSVIITDDNGCVGTNSFNIGYTSISKSKIFIIGSPNTKNIILIK